MSGTFNPDGTVAGRDLGISGRGQSTPPDTGYGLGQSTENLSLALRQRYAPPTQFEKAPYSGGGGVDDPKYNTAAQFPVKYAYPTSGAERMDIKNEIRREAPGPNEDGTGARIVDTIGDDEINFVQSVRAQSRVADIDKYVNSLIDPRKPGQLKWLMEVYPQYVERRIAQVHTDYEFALRNQLIDMYGINTFDDLMFKYMVDQGEITGPELARRKPAASAYTAGVFAPARWQKPDRSDGNKMKMPFNSAKVGAKPAVRWELQNPGPLGERNDNTAIIQNMFGRGDGLAGPPEEVN